VRIDSHVDAVDDIKPPAVTGSLNGKGVTELIEKRGQLMLEKLQGLRLPHINPSQLANVIPEVGMGQIFMLWHGRVVVPPYQIKAPFLRQGSERSVID